MFGLRCESILTQGAKEQGNHHSEKQNERKGNRMIFVFNPDKSISLQDAEICGITIQPEDFELVVDVLLVALERAREA